MQSAEIQQELTEVSADALKWKNMYEKSSSDEKKQNNAIGFTDFQKKQLEIDLQHNITVSKIKSDIYLDRKQFLENLIKIDEDAIKEKE